MTISHNPPFGANLVAPGSDRFRLWAPDCRPGSLEIEDEADRDAAAGWTVRSPKPRVAPARDIATGCADLAVPDPAARAQSGDVHDASLVVDPRAYAWRHADVAWPAVA